LYLIDADGDVVAEVFRCDGDKTVAVTVHRADVPAAILEELVDLARRVPGPFEDGTPLPPAFGHAEWPGA
jgi:hypothetical protein